MHSQHAAPRGHDTTVKWYGRAYTREAKPHNVNDAGHIDGPFPRAGAGALWLDVLKNMVEEMPTPMVPATVLGSHSGAGLPMQELRNELLLRSTPVEQRDAAWRYVVTQVREVRHDWTYFALGLALPGLWNAALHIAPRPETPFSQVALVHRRIATEFVDSLGKVKLDQGYIVARLIQQAIYAAKGHQRRKPPPPMVELSVLDYLPADDRAAAGKPKTGTYIDALIALARLVRQTAKNKPGRILTVTDAQLIAYTYIDGHTLAQAAPWVNLTEPAARMRRDRARKLVAALLAGKTGRREIHDETT